MENNNIPKVLILSNTPLHLSDSNGRVLGFLLNGIPNDRKIQFCIQGNSVSEELIDNCYRITDIEIAKGFLSKKIQAHKLPNFDQPGLYKSRKKRVKRTPLSMLLRDIAWTLCLKKTDYFVIASRFQPDIILWQYGDSGFMARLSLALSKVCNAKLVIFSTEDYCFKKWNYLTKKRRGIIYNLFFREMYYSTKKALENSTLCIFNTPQLAKRFHDEFKITTNVIMQSANSSVSRIKSLSVNEKIVIYAGNLGLNRHLSLIEIAKEMNCIDPSICFEIYGHASEKVMQAFINEPNIKYNGFVSYESILNRTSTSLLSVHAESFEDFYKKDLQAAFSTKIPDLLASKTPLFIYAPDCLAETQYLKNNGCAFVCTERNSLRESLESALYDNKLRDEVVYKSMEIVNSNHNNKKNENKMIELLNKVVSGTAVDN